MASTTRTITAMGMSQAAARAYTRHHAVAPIAGTKGCPSSWQFQKNDVTTRRSEDPGAKAG